MKTIDKGKELNKVLGKTARNIFIYGLLLSLGILLG
jgi:1,4-dihydroxy-2-naphthoate octaprenyltransferase